MPHGSFCKNFELHTFLVQKFYQSLFSSELKVSIMRWRNKTNCWKICIDSLVKTLCFLLKRSSLGWVVQKILKIAVAVTADSIWTSSVLLKRPYNCKGNSGNSPSSIAKGWSGFESQMKETSKTLKMNLRNQIETKEEPKRSRRGAEEEPEQELDKNRALCMQWTQLFKKHQL